MRKSRLALAALCLGSLAALGAWSVTERADCPGKIICPLTGELVCRDQCPAEASKDCSNHMNGQNGDLVSVDRCPSKGSRAAKPSCCDRVGH